MLGLRHQLAAHSPLPLTALLGAAWSGSRRGAAESLAHLLADEYVADSVVLCGSGTQALQLAIVRAARQAGGDPVVALPAFCCYDVASAAVGAGARVALYDLDPETLSPDVVSLERLLKDGVRVIVVAHLYGIPVRWDEVAALAAAYGAVLVEDAAQGHGALWAGRPLGSLGSLSVLSFGRGKGWTGGRGGALLLRSDAADGPPTPLDAAPTSQERRNLVASFAQWALGRPSLYGLPMALPGLALGETVYHPPTAPHAIPEGAARLLLRAEAAACEEALARKAAAGELLRSIAGVPGVGAMRIAPEADPGYLRLPLRLPRGMESLGDVRRARRLGIAPSYPTPLATLPAIRERMLAAPSTPGAEVLARVLLTLPTHSRLRRSDLERIRRSLLNRSLA